MLRVIIVSALLVVSIAAGTIAYAWGPLRDLPDQTVQTPIGPLALTHLRVDHSMGSVFLFGDVTNNTSRGWDDVSLGVSFKDKSGDVTMRATPDDRERDLLFVHLQDLAPGKTQKFSIHGFAKADKGTIVLAVTYADGSFPVLYRVSLAKPIASDTPTYETDKYALAFSVRDKALHFALRNKGDGPIRIDWNSVAYVDTTGQSTGVIHNGVKLVDRTAPKAPTMVPPGASIEDEIVPVNNVELVNMQWITHPLLPTGPTGLKAVGSQFTVFLPLEIDGKAENRSFVFKIIGAS